MPSTSYGGRNLQRVGFPQSSMNTNPFWKMSFLQTITLVIAVMIVFMFCVGCDNTNKGSEESKPEIEVVLIPKGDFFMGSDNQYDQPDQHPKHKVSLDSFAISKHEITRREYGVFMRAGGYATRELWSEEGWKFLQENKISAPAGWYVHEFDSPAHPVVGVSWYEAQAFAKWLGFRLPSEAEWEKAARGTDAQRYPWGDEIDRTKVEYTGFTWLRVIGSYPRGASPYGVMDMAGNVWEWVSDWYESDYYQRSPTKNPQGPESGTQKILRGGGWESNRRHLQCSYRREENPRWRGSEIGFRIASDAPRIVTFPK